MSGEQLASSFGDANVRPPTPKQSPTSAVFRSPILQTPKNNRQHFDESSGWTPYFAEEYSVFNTTTPGNLRGSQGSHVEFGSISPFPPVAGQKRPLSTEGIAAEIASRVNHFSSNPNLPLPPVELSKRLPSSPGPLHTGFDQSIPSSQKSNNSERSAKKPRRGTVAESVVQTVTPPPSARKSGRKLAPKLDANAMQNDQSFSEADFAGGGQQPDINAFMTTSSDMFGYPLSAPATAPIFTDQRPFWETDTSMANMSLDFGTVDAADMFQTSTSHHRPMGSVDWGTANQIFQETGVPPGGSQENSATARQERPLAPKPMMADFSAHPNNDAVYPGSYSAPVNDPFGMVRNAGGVDPGLLFSQPQSSSLDAVSFDTSMLPPNMSMPPNAETSQPSGPVPIAPKGSIPVDFGRSSSVKGKAARKKKDRATASSPIKSTGRPGLSRSFSEDRGKRPMSRAALPTLVPAPRPQSQEQPMAYSGGQFGRPIVRQPNKPSGRTSPLKSQHQRLPSLSSIPETTGPRTQTHAKFTIDANGRASVETTVIINDDEAPRIRKTHSAQSMVPHRRWNSSEDDDSSTDDEPIIIPSRNTSFALPDPRKPSGIHPFHSSQRSISERSTMSFATLQGSLQDDGDSEAETVLNGRGSASKSLGDAASELRRLRESRQKQPSTLKPRRFISGPTVTASFAGSYAGYDLVSPTTVTDTSLPTPTDSKGYGVRCVCNRPEVDCGGDDFMVQCESCEMWLHGSCINISRRTLPSVYICAFCANTPNMRGGRMRDGGRVGGAMLPPSSATSPLAHKSFKSFR